MKALSIRQPWLYCITHLDKRVENRSWSPPPELIGQRIALHASASLRVDECRDAVHLAETHPEGGLPIDLGGFIRDMGKIVATATLVGYVDAGTRRSKPRPFGEVEIDKWLDDHWFAGRYGLILDDIQLLDFAIPCKGRLGFWNIPPEEAAFMPDYQEVQPSLFGEISA